MSSSVDFSQEESFKTANCTQNKDNQIHETSIDTTDQKENLSLTPITIHDIERNPQTPLLRLSLKDNGINTSFSPVSDAGNIIDEDKENTNRIRHKSIADARNECKKVSMKTAKEPTPSHRSKFLSQSTPLSPIIKDVNNQSQKKQDSSGTPKSTYNYDINTSREMLKRKPELITAVNERGEINPLKGMKTVSFSPNRESKFHALKSYDSAKSSPLTDSINNNEKNSAVFEDDEPYNKSSPSRKSSRRKPNNKNNKKSRGLLDPELPYVLSLYLQLFFNVVIVSILLYFIYTFISTVKADVENKVDSYASDIVQEIALCTREYHRNHCLPGERVVALEAVCSNWERCMNRDPTALGRAKIGAETFAEIINGFIKPISWKSIIFLSLITIGSLVLTNIAFGSYRDYSGIHRDNKVKYHDPSQQQNQNNEDNIQQALPPASLQLTPYQSLKSQNSFSRYYSPNESIDANEQYIPGMGSDEVVKRKLKFTKRSKR